MSTLPGYLKDTRFYSETPRQGKVILVTPLKSLVISGFGKTYRPQKPLFYKHFTLRVLFEQCLAASRYSTLDVEMKITTNLHSLRPLSLKRLSVSCSNPAYYRFSRSTGCLNVRHAEILCQRRMLLCHFFIHGVSHVPVGKMSRRAAAQLGNIERFGKIHFKERPLAKRHGQDIQPGVCSGCVELAAGTAPLSGSPLCSAPPSPLP